MLGQVLSLVGQSLGEPNFGWVKIVQNSGGEAKVVLAVLALMSCWSLGVIIDRWLAFRAARTQSRMLAPLVSTWLQDGNTAEVIKICRESRKSHLAKVILASLKEVQPYVGPAAIPAKALRSSKKAADRAIVLARAELRRGISSLATIGSTAPFVGLLGTVIGIVNAFQGMSAAQTTGLSTVAKGISEALAATAMGLFVALPAVWMFNYLNSKLENFAVEMDNSAAELSDYFTKRADP
jgi:biopolymer transport protein ExbB/biopolymer transport protein TolQ